MNYTPEQQAILAAAGDLSIAAVAGSGKTTTVIEYARSRPAGSRILYLAFNRSVKMEAVQKFRAAGLHNVRVETAHSLAYSYIIPGSGYTLSQGGYKPHDIVEMLHLSGARADTSTYGPHVAHIIARHILALATAFCNSRAEKVSELDYSATVSSTGRALVEAFYNRIQRGARELLARMHRAEIPIIHDFYLKEFHLSRPQLPYDYVLFDEGQDASPAMADVFASQAKAVKVIVGDPHQQIYGWRGAYNAMGAAGFAPFTLSQSFRFGPDIARLAADILDWKAHLGTHGRVRIEGIAETGSDDAQETSEQPAAAKSPVAVLARTNLGLLVRAIEAVQEKGIQRLYFEGNIQSYTYADEGASLYDVLSLYTGERGRIRDPFIRKMHDLKELEEYVEQTEDRQLGMLVEVVKKWNVQLPAILKKLKAAHVPDEERGTADYIFSTVHRAKGMEYDQVELAADFISEKTIEREAQVLRAMGGKNDKAGKVPAVIAQDVARLSEEINLLYVAVTRAKKKLLIPEFLKPKEFPDSPAIEWLRKPPTEEARPGRQAPAGASPFRSAESANGAGLSRSIGERKAKAYDLDEIRQSHRKAYRPWDEAQDSELRQFYERDQSIEKLAAHFGRTTGAIHSRLKKLMIEE